MRICVVGSGYVGLVTGTCLAEVGHVVTAIDIDQNKIDLLNNGGVPIHEPGLDQLIAQNKKAGRINFTTDYSVCEDADAVFIGVGTPPGEDGSADLHYVLAAAKSIAEHAPDCCLVIVKSTVPVGTSDKVEACIKEIATKRGIRIHVAFNPEFLREGDAISDFLRPDRIVVGVEDEFSEHMMQRIYAPFNRNHNRMQVLDRRSAEMTKYAANCMLATRISFMNELARLCENVGADIEAVRKGIGSDSRIGPSFLYAGIGYGGSCFPKDVSALIATARQNDAPLTVVEAVESANKNQRQWFVDRLLSNIKKLGIDKPRIAVWGLAFKPGTDDLREAPSLQVVEALAASQCSIIAHDPAAMDAFRDVLGDTVSFVDNPMTAAEGADALVVLTEWLCFREPDWKTLQKSMRNKLIFDGRNLYIPEEVRQLGFKYWGVGRAIPQDAS